jgi:phage shock protein C
MTGNNNRSDWTVLLGLGLLTAGVWLLLGKVFAWLAWPLAYAVRFLGSIGWPLVLVGLGVFLIMRARTEGWNMSGKKLFRSRTDRKVGGVLGGGAVYLNVDSNILRLIYVALTLLTGFWAGFLIYAIAMIVVPEEEFVVGAQAPSVPTAPAPAPSVPTQPAAAAAAPVAEAPAAPVAPPVPEAPVASETPASPAS